MGCSRIGQQTTDILTLTLRARRDVNDSSYPELSLSQKRHNLKDSACTVFLEVASPAHVSSSASCVGCIIM